MLLLKRQRYKMNDTLDSMYPNLKANKRTAQMFIDRMIQISTKTPITAKVDGPEIVYSLRDEDRPRKPMMRLIRPVNGPISVVLEVGDYAMVQRRSYVKW